MLILLCLNPSAHANLFNIQTTAKMNSLKNVAYGHHPEQIMDIYFPSKPLAEKQPDFFSDDSWCFDWIFISINYRLLPDATVQQQTQDVATALIYIQNHASDWHADPKQLVLMGHSAGAHLVSLLSTRPAWLTSQPQAWRTSIALDSAAYDIEKIMQARHARFYDQAFGNQPSNWKALSPTLQLHQALFNNSPRSTMYSSTTICSTSAKTRHPSTVIGTSTFTY